MVDYSRWDRLEVSDDEVPRQRGDRLVSEMVNDPKARKHWTGKMKEMTRDEKIRSRVMPPPARQAADASEGATGTPRRRGKVTMQDPELNRAAPSCPPTINEYIWLSFLFYLVVYDSPLLTTPSPRPFLFAGLPLTALLCFALRPILRHTAHSHSHGHSHGLLDSLLRAAHPLALWQYVASQRPPSRLVLTVTLLGIAGVSAVRSVWQWPAWGAVLAVVVCAAAVKRLTESPPTPDPRRPSRR